MLDVLIYTDCSAEESVSGRSGFQFHAESAGVTAHDEYVVQERLLHTVPLALPSSDPDRHPPSCAYVSDAGSYYLARGRSIGRTRSGRPGNQLTQAVVAREATDLLPYRPAQLLSCPDWHVEKSPDRLVQGWPTPLVPHPSYQLPGLHDLVGTNPWAREHLPELFTMAEQAFGDPRTKLILVHRDLYELMRWIAVVTLVDDGARALDVSFRAFVEDPLAARYDIVGAHPDLSPNLVPEVAQGVNIVDIPGQRISPCSTSESARLHADWFLRADPFQALEAIEASRRWALSMGPDLAARGAALATGITRPPHRLDDVRDACAVLTALEGADLDEELDGYGDELIDVITQYPPAHGDDPVPLVVALGALRTHGHDGLAAAIATAALEWARSQPSVAAAWAAHASQNTTPIAPLSWPVASELDHERALLAEVLQACPDQDLPAWFAIGAFLNLPLTEVQAVPVAVRLAVYWAEQPDVGAQRGTWLHADTVTQQLAHLLLDRLRAGTPQTLADVAAGRWDWLRTAGGHDVPELDGWLGLARLPTIEPAHRRELLRAAAHVLPSWAARRAVELRDDLAGYAADASVWLGEHHEQLPEDFSDDLADAIDRSIARGDRATYNTLMGVLHDHAGLPAGHRVRDAVEDAIVIRDNRIAAGDARADAVNTPLRALAELRPALLALYADELADLVVHGADQHAVRRLMRATDGALDAAVRAAGSARLRAGSSAVLARLLLLEADGDVASPGVTGALDEFFATRRHAKLRERMADRLPPRAAKLYVQRAERSRGRIVKAVRSLGSGLRGGGER